MSRLSLDDRNVTFDAKEIIYGQGDKSRHLYIVKSGIVRLIHLNEEGRPLLMGEISSGQVLGELGILTGKERTLTAISKTKVELVRVKASDISMQLKKYPEWVDQLMKTLCQRLLDADKMLISHKIKDDRLLVSMDTKEENEIKKLIKKHMDSRKTIG